MGQLLDTKKGLPGTAAETHPEDSPCQQDRQAYIVGQVLFFWPVTSTIFFLLLTSMVNVLDVFCSRWPIFLEALNSLEPP